MVMGQWDYGTASAVLWNRPTHYAPRTTHFPVPNALRTTHHALRTTHYALRTSPFKKREIKRQMEALQKEILAQVNTPETRNYVIELLLEICRVDTSPFADVNLMREAENKVFQSLEREFAKISFPDARLERRAIDPAIENHPGFSQLHFTKTEERPQGLSTEETYRERGNLLYFVPGENGVEANGVALNAHIDVVKPYVPPRLENDIIYGRGACDDKGSIVTMLTALKVLAAVLQKSGRRLRRNLVAMCVIEEEPGGNGSLSLAIDRELKKLYDSILVLECCGNNIHPANRGAVWYRADLSCPGANLFEMSAFVYEQMELAGRAIKAESRHPLFPQRPVQTCHGQIGHYGEHPSRICGEVAFEICFDGEINSKVENLVEDGIASALQDYLALYGDKSKVNDPTTGLPKVERHYDLEMNGKCMLCKVHGSTGHMGSIMENDGAITKMACLVRMLYRMKEKLRQASGGEVTLKLHAESVAPVLTLEGGQGFVPTHEISEVMERMRAAAIAGAAAICVWKKIPPPPRIASRSAMTSCTMPPSMVIRTPRRCAMPLPLEKRPAFGKRGKRSPAGLSPATRDFLPLSIPRCRC